MPTPGLSLVGFMDDQAQALLHLKNICVPPKGRSDVELIQDWHDAQAKLGAPVTNAGQCNMVPIPMNDPHIHSLLPAWAASLQQYLRQGATFYWVEIAPLLSFQLVVDKDRSAFHFGPLGSPPSDDLLLATCLPPNFTTDAIHFSQQGQSLIIKSRSLNLNLIAPGPLPTGGIGMATFGELPNLLRGEFEWSLPFLHVVRLRGKCILRNGYHRAYGAALAGATHVPCLFRDVPNEATAGIQTDGNTLPPSVMASQNPPTMTHFIENRAADVQLRATTRIIQVNWAQHTMLDE
jgi:hypothetical protein